MIFLLFNNTLLCLSLFTYIYVYYKLHIERSICINPFTYNRRIFFSGSRWLFIIVSLSLTHLSLYIYIYNIVYIIIFLTAWLLMRPLGFMVFFCKETIIRQLRKWNFIFLTAWWLLLGKKFMKPRGRSLNSINEIYISNINIFIIIYSFRVFHISISWWFFTGV